MTLCYSGNAQRHRTVTGMYALAFLRRSRCCRTRAAGQTLIWRGL